MTQLKLYTVDKLSSTIFCCLSVSKASVTPDQISTFSNVYRHTSPLLTLYHLLPSNTNLYWPFTSQYRHILTQYHQVPIIIHHLVNWIISLFTTHLMSHAQNTWSSLYYVLLSTRQSFVILLNLSKCTHGGISPPPSGWVVVFQSAPLAKIQINCFLWPTDGWKELLLLESKALIFP